MLLKLIRSISYIYVWVYCNCILVFCHNVGKKFHFQAENITFLLEVGLILTNMYDHSDHTLSYYSGESVRVYCSISTAVHTDGVDVYR